MEYFLCPLSFLYRAVTQIKFILYRYKICRAKKADIPIISVGNITFGGSEKTPLVMELLSALLRNRYKPALISRGYKGNWENNGGVLSNGKEVFGNWKDSGDEPFMIYKNFPETGIFIGENRFVSIDRAKELGFQLAVLDDGFQYLALKKDLNIVLYDPSEKIALREPVSSLKRAHIIIIKREISNEIREELEKRFPDADLFEYSVVSRGIFRLGEKEAEPFETLRGKNILALCGIARPQRFFSLLKENGVKPQIFLKFSDHYSYPVSSIKKIEEAYYNSHSEAIITTEKDIIKVSTFDEFKNLPVYFLKIGLEIEEEFYEKLFSLLKSKERYH